MLQSIIFNIFTKYISIKENDVFYLIYFFLSHSMQLWQISDFSVYFSKTDGL